MNVEFVINILVAVTVAGGIVVPWILMIRDIKNGKDNWS